MFCLLCFLYNLIRTRKNRAEGRCIVTKRESIPSAISQAQHILPLRETTAATQNATHIAKAFCFFFPLFSR